MLTDDRQECVCASILHLHQDDIVRMISLYHPEHPMTFVPLADTILPMEVFRLVQLNHLRSEVVVVETT